jgi:hypothetical protein
MDYIIKNISIKYMKIITQYECPVRLRMTEPSDIFHNLMVLSLLPLASIYPSGENATVFTYLSNNK